MLGPIIGFLFMREVGRVLCYKNMLADDPLSVPSNGCLVKIPCEDSEFWNDELCP